MAELKLKIAGRVGSIQTQFESTAAYCSKYLTEDAPDFFAEITPENRVFEQEASWEEARIEGFRPRRYTDPHLERAALQRVFAEHLFDYDILLFHGSLVAVDGSGYLFAAKSGTGKSTHTRLWCQLFSDRAVMVNDDKPFLSITEDGVLASGSPWSGKHGLDTNITVPLKGICILERGTENRIQPLPPEDALEFLLWQSYCPLNPEKEPQRLLLANKLAHCVPLWKMECTKDLEAAKTAYRAMCPKKQQTEDSV